MLLDAGTEALHLTGVVWWAEELSLKIKIKEQFLGSSDPHQVTAKPFRKRRPTLVDLRNILHPTGLPPLDLNFLMDGYKILIWNCRGAGNNRFKNNFRELMRIHSLEIVAILEPKVSMQSMGLFFRNLGFTRDTFTDPNGRYGGIWVLWDPTKVAVFTIEVKPQVIHVKIRKNGYEDWILSALYASPNPRLREILWEDLKEFANSNTHAWSAAGDFNEIATMNENRSSTTDTGYNQRRKFMENINACNLMEIGAS